MESYQLPPAATRSRCEGASNYATNIRLLTPADQSELRRIFLTLEPSACYCKFGRAASDVSLIDHANNSLATADWIIAAFVGERIRGVVEGYSSGLFGWVEAAFVVEKDWRRRGLGWALLQAAIRQASQCEASKLRMVFSRENWPMRNLAHKARAELDFVLDEMCADVVIRSDSRL